MSMCILYTIKIYSCTFAYMYVICIIVYTCTHNHAYTLILTVHVYPSILSYLIIVPPDRSITFVFILLSIACLRNNLK